MKRFFSSLFLLIAFFIIYFLFAPLKTAEIKTYYIDKYFNINDKISVQKNNDGYFYSAEECGYFSINDGITYYKKVSDNDQYILANSIFYLTYKKNGESVKIYNTNGTQIAQINSHGYPYIPENLPAFYVIKTNGMGFSLYSNQGEAIIKDINLTSMITCISTDKFINSLVSTVDGKTFLYSSKGEILQEFNTQGSRIQIAKSNFLPLDGKTIALCTGIEPEIIETYDKNSKKLLIKFKTDTNFRYKTFLKTINNRIYYEGKNEIKYYDFKTKKHGSLKINGEINEISLDKIGNVLISSNDNNLNYLTIFSEQDSMMLYKEFYETASNFRFINNNEFYFKLSDIIIKMTGR